MDMYIQNKRKLEHCVCDNPTLPCTCGYMKDVYKKGGNEVIGLINDLSLRLGKIEGALEMLLMEIKRNMPDLDISAYEKILEEDRV